jgi:signal transduction histidine kinase
MKDIKKKLAQSKNINEVYELLSNYLKNTLKNSVCILVQLDEKQDEAFVYSLIGLKTPLFNKLIRILGLDPVGKRFRNTPIGRKRFFSSNKLIPFQGNLSQFSEGAIPDWICNVVETVFNIKNIYTIGISYENVLIGSVMVFPRMDDTALFIEIEKNITFFSKRMKEIIDTYKQDILGLDTRDIFTKAILNNISHEIRTPLNGIVGLMDAGLRLLNDNENTKELTSIIWKNSLELTNKLDNLLVLSDFQTNGTHISPKSLSANVIAFEVEQIVREQSSVNKDRNIILNINIDELNIPVVSIDMYYFKLIVVELINNALKFSEKDITINLNGNKVLKIEICDEGIGMTEKEITEYVKAFNRNKEICEKYTGMGIGLSIVKHIVKKHNWQISFNSTIDKGTSVTIYLERHDIENTALNTSSNLNENK